MPRELVAWEVLAGGGPVQPGAPLALPGADGSETGRVTSAVMHPLTGRACGLAYVRLGRVPKDSRLLVEMNLASIRRLIPVPSV